MNTKHNRKKSVIAALGAAVVGAALPAVLFAGAGTARAAATLNTTSDALGVTAMSTPRRRRRLFQPHLLSTTTTH